MTHILAFHAHPDDIETLGAGTLALLAANGHRVTLATMTAGDCGAIDTSAEETARIRGEIQTSPTGGNKILVPSDDPAGTDYSSDDDRAAAGC